MLEQFGTFLATTDVKDCFYRMRIPKSLAEYDGTAACCEGSPGCELWVEVNASGTTEAVVTAKRQLVLGNRRCPFGDKVIGRPALCMMTSNVFGVIAAENAGYARVDIQKAIANGDGHCHVVVSLDGNDMEAGREYFRSGE